MEWIRSSDRLPDLYDFVLVFADNKGTGEPRPISIARWDSEKWEFINNPPSFPSYGAWMDIEYNMDSEDITHWMPLPKIPKKNE